MASRPTAILFVLAHRPFAVVCAWVETWRRGSVVSAQRTVTRWCSKKRNRGLLLGKETKCKYYEYICIKQIRVHCRDSEEEEEHRGSLFRVKKFPGDLRAPISSAGHRALHHLWKHHQGPGSHLHSNLHTAAAGHGHCLFDMTCNTPRAHQRRPISREME